ncbi:MAG: hypothetical protein AAGA48_40210, partial [Myxococcota bacterium]
GERVVVLDWQNLAIGAPSVDHAGLVLMTQPEAQADLVAGLADPLCGVALAWVASYMVPFFASSKVDTRAPEPQLQLVWTRLTHALGHMAGVPGVG